MTKRYTQKLQLARLTYYEHSEEIVVRSGLVVMSVCGFINVYCVFELSNRKIMDRWTALTSALHQARKTVNSQAALWLDSREELPHDIAVPLARVLVEASVARTNFAAGSLFDHHRCIADVRHATVCVVDAVHRKVGFGAWFEK